MQLAVDVMGGDHGCGVLIKGALLALESNSSIRKIYLVGNEDEIRKNLARVGSLAGRLEIVHASEMLTMDEKPIEALRRKKDCSILKAVELVKESKADALISPGNTGGVMAASTIKLRPLEGIERPAIATVIPTRYNRFVLLDSGANVECKPIYLLQFAIMGAIYSREVLGCKNPKIGLLSIGTEEVKGNDLTLEAFRLLKASKLNFHGNVEGHDLFKGKVDVVVCDGFVGNIVLKTCESLAMELFDWLKSELTSNPLRKAGALLCYGAFRTIKKQVDPDQQGAAPLLGLNGTVMITHGSARERAIMNAILITCEAARHKINDHIINEIAAVKNILSKPSIEFATR